MAIWTLVNSTIKAKPGAATWSCAPHTAGWPRAAARWRREPISLPWSCRAVGGGITWRLPLRVDRCTAVPELLHAHLPSRLTHNHPKSSLGDLNR
jgi:hypothetical protein